MSHLNYQLMTARETRAKGERAFLQIDQIAEKQWRLLAQIHLFPRCREKSEGLLHQHISGYIHLIIYTTKHGEESGDIRPIRM